MSSETKNCQNCKNNFTIELDDFSFYEKIKVPSPTFCPECRLIRRMCWRNVRSLYRRNCNLCQKVLFSMYSDDGAPVMCVECWNGDDWDIYQNNQDIDWNKDLFSQILKILKKQPRIYQYRVGGNVINSEYANSIANSKNIYLAFSLLDSENISYSESVDFSKDSMDSLTTNGVDGCSWNISSNNNFNCHFMLDSSRNLDSYFLYDCQNCSNCFMSTNLRNKSFVFKNEQYSEVDYKKILKEYNLNTHTGFEKAKEEFFEIKEKAIHRYSEIYKSVESTGNYISNSKNAKKSFDITDAEDLKNTYRIVKSKDLLDCSWVLTGELEYESISGSGQSFYQIGSIVCFASTQMYYSIFCRNSSNCFACVGLKNAKYCVLNKQYTKEEYEQLIPKLIAHMNEVPYVDKKGRIYKYGEFFPYEFSPFGYNETVALDYFPKYKEDAIFNGFNWMDREDRDYFISIASNDLPNDIKETNDSILNEVISCPNKGNQTTQCTSAYKIRQEDLNFYRQKGLPIPRYCPNCRHYERLKYKNPLRLWQRSCMCEQSGHFHGEGQCEVEFETTYAPERPEKVYCEQCYQAEVL